MTWEELPINKIEAIIGYCFKNKDLLRQAFTTTRYWYSKTSYNHDLLPYIGKAIVDDEINNLVKEKELTSNKANFIKNESNIIYINLMNEVNFASYLVYAPGENLNEYQKQMEIANLFPLIVCAVYFDEQCQVTTEVKNVIQNILQHQFK